MYEVCSFNICCSGKAVSITHSECLSVTLGIQHVMPMCRVVFTSVSCPALPHVSTLSDTRQYFHQNFTERKIGVFDILSNFYLKKSYILGRNERDIISFHRSSCKVPVIVVKFK